MAGKFRRQDDLPSWRKIALHTWRDAGDPSVYGTLECDMTEALPYLAALREKTGVKTTPTHLVAKAVANAIAEHPDVNGIVCGRRLYLRDTVDIFLQVAIDGGKDLSGAKITDVDRKTVAELAAELAVKADKLRKHQDKEIEHTQKMMKRTPNFLVTPMLRIMSWLTYNLGLDLSRLGIPHDQFGSAMVTSVGMFGLSNGLAPLIGWAHTAMLLLVGEVQKKAVVVDDQLAVRPMLTLGATFDHRVMDGWHASVLAKSVKDTIENPLKRLGAP